MRTPIKLVTMMSGGGATAAELFQDQILAMSPIAYWPMDDTSGTTIRDATGNSRTGTHAGSGTYATLAQTGQIGTCAKITNTTANYAITLSAALLSAIDPKNFSIVMFVKIPTTTEAKLYEGYNDDASPDYSAFEIRAGTLSVFLREDAVTQTINTVYGYKTAPNDQWVMYVLFNNEASGISGYYHNKLYLPGTRTLTGGFDGAVTATLTGMFAEFDGGPGYIQHVAWFNRAITQSEVDALYDAAFGAESWSLSYLFRDDFTTDDDAPITSPRTCEPGPGTLTTVDTGNHFAIASGSLTWSARTGDNVPRTYSDAIAKAYTRAFVGKATPGRLAFGFGRVTTVRPAEAAVNFFANALYIAPNAGSLDLAPATAGSEYSVAIVLKQYGALYMIKGGIYTNWTLIYVDHNTSDDDVSVYVLASEYVTSATTTINTMRVCDLPWSAWNPYGIVSTRLAGKRAITDTFTHDADCNLEFTIVALPGAGEIIDFRFRKQDATNYWNVTVAADGTIDLNEVVDGSLTQRATKASGATTGTRIYIQCFGQTIRAIYFRSGYVIAWTYATAANFVTETDGALAATGAGVVSDIIVWPRTVGATAAAYLDAALA